MNNPADFLARWSRRKRQAERNAATPAAASPLPDEKLPASAAATNRSAPPDPHRENPQAEAGARSDSAGVDLSRLPSPESISAETDIRPFLASGVPAELTRAALRRAWAADPTIREHVGLSENSWDFNAHGAMPGFGPLEITDQLKQAVDRILGRTPQSLGGPENARAIGTPSDQTHDAAAQTQDESHKCDEAPHCNRADAAPQSNSEKGT